MVHNIGQQDNETIDNKTNKTTVQNKWQLTNLNLQYKIEGQEDIE